MVWVGDEEDSDEEKPFTKDANYDQLEPLQSSQTPVWNPGYCCHTLALYLLRVFC